ncbi:MAG: class I SAM-dependent methyltransferase [Caldimonas sp.]
MPWSPPFSRAPGPADLSRRLKKLDRVFSFDRIRAQGMGAGEVIAYYEECSPAYRKHHSREGSMHLAISPGRFRPEGFYGQLERISAAWPAEPPDDVLELGFGQGFNLAWLAARFPAVRFSGIDLTPTHPGLARGRLDQLGLKNVVLAEGDFHALPHADQSFDHVYAIEAFCYARDLKQALSEVARVLRPGGSFRLFDGYLVRRPETFSAEEALAVELLARGMALERFQLVDDIVDTARATGLETLAVTSLDAEVAPNLKKLERLTGAVIRFPWLGRRALARRSPMRGRNVISGYLMYSTVALGLTGYREILLRKPG